MKTQRKRLPKRVKAGYGIAELGMSSVEVMLQLYLLVFYTQVIGLEARLAGIALALAVVWDAIVDPAMGVISDNVNTRWGRRRPFIFFGSIFLGLSFLLLFNPPETANQTTLFLFLLFSYMLVNTSMTIINVPHSALGGELSFDPHERTEIFGWRQIFKNAGLVIGAMVPGVTLTVYQQMGYTSPQLDFAARGTAATILCVLTIVAALGTLLTVRKLDVRLVHFPARTRKSIWLLIGEYLGSLWTVATNRAFMPLLAAYAVAFVGRTINASLALYYYQIYLGLTEFQVTVYVLGLFMAVLTASVIVWVKMSRRWGKKMPAFWGALTLGIITCVTYPLLPPGQIWAPLVFSSVLGGFVIGSIILFDSLVADVVDYDELRTKKQREGLYFGCWLMVTKLSRACALVLTGFMLNAIGFEEGALVQAPEVGWRIALLFGPGVGIFFIIAAFVFLLMPLTPARHSRVQDLLRKRHELDRARAA